MKRRSRRIEIENKKKFSNPLTKKKTPLQKEDKAIIIKRIHRKIMIINKRKRIFLTSCKGHHTKESKIIFIVESIRNYQK